MLRTNALCQVLLRTSMPHLVVLLLRCFAAPVRVACVPLLLVLLVLLLVLLVLLLVLPCRCCPSTPQSRTLCCTTRPTTRNTARTVKYTMMPTTTGVPATGAARIQQLRRGAVSAARSASFLSWRVLNYRYRLASESAGNAGLSA